MPKPKQPKPAAAEAPKPSKQPQADSPKKDARIRRQKELHGLIKMSGDLNDRKFGFLKTFAFITKRAEGFVTPIEQFIEDLVRVYESLEKDGQGMTIEDVEAELRNLRDYDLPRVIKHAHFIASRYSLPEPKEDKATV